ncbi:MAG: tetratricopeptide repeat family protein, partial [Alphaproteobacteria bacterium]|nr:tetratricopeptide repeat family protein [Alphaproteobacteria bacterium]
LTAILLGTAAVGGAAFVLAVPAQAATVSAKVGALLTEAKSLIAAKNYGAAKAKLNEAEAAASTPDDRSIIASFKNLIAVSSADPNTPQGAKAKFAQDYNAGRYKDVIADADFLRKQNVFDGQSQLIVGQAYYKSGDFAGCVRYSKSLGGAGGDTALELQARCAYETGDDATQHAALESLVSRGGKAEHWKLLLKLSDRTSGLNDHNSLDINRIRLITGNIQTKDEYTLLAQLALQLGNAAEAQSIVEKGIAAKVLTDDRSTRLLNLAKTQAAANAANLQKNLAAARTQPQGDALIKVGEDMIGQGKAKDAIAVIQEGLKKPLKDPANGQIRLGHAYLAAGQKADAVAAFAKVKEPAKDAMVAHLWSLASRK